MSNTSSDTLISKIRNYCHTLRDDGPSYGEYLAQETGDELVGVLLGQMNLCD